MRLKVLVLALVLAVSFAGVFAPAAKAEGPAVTPYADVLFWVGGVVKDKYSSRKQDKDGEPTGDTDVIMGITPQGSIGVRGMVNNVNVNFAIMSRTPTFELKTNPLDTDEQSQPFMFIGVMMYNFGPVNLTVGRFFTNYDILSFSDTNVTATNLGWDMMLSYSLFDATRDQITLSFPVGLYLTLAKNSKNEDANSDVLIPLLAVGYMYGNPGTPMNFSVHGLFQTYKDDGVVIDSNGDGTADTFSDNTVNSWAVAGKFGMNMAPVSFYVTGFYGQNTTDMGMASGGGHSYDGDSVKNNIAYAGHAGVDYVMGAVKLGAGIGYKQNKQDVSGANADKAMAYFVSLKYNIQPNFAITPSVLIQDGMKNAQKQKEGKTISIGALFEAHI